MKLKKMWYLSLFPLILLIPPMIHSDVQLVSHSDIDLVNYSEFSSM